MRKTKNERTGCIQYYSSASQSHSTASSTHILPFFKVNFASSIQMDSSIEFLWIV
jgi:hypothetical protein